MTLTRMLLAAAAAAGVATAAPAGHDPAAKPALRMRSTAAVSSALTDPEALPQWGQFETGTSPVAKWNYDIYSPYGPAHWGDILLGSNTSSSGTPGSRAYPLCAERADGTQSPINIVTTARMPVDIGNQTLVPPFPLTVAAAPIDLVRKYTTTQFQIVPRPGGYPGFQIDPLNGDATWLVDGVRYHLTSFHYHSPSEHTFNGTYMPLEVHLVHESDDGRVAVMGILYPFNDTEAPDTYLHPFWDEIYYSHVMNLSNTIDLAGMLDDITGDVWRYDGSLTTPPCTEGLKWFVTVSQHGINSAQKITYNYALNLIANFRPLQPLHGRAVTQYRANLPSKAGV